MTRKLFGRHLLIATISVAGVIGGIAVQARDGAVLTPGISETRSITVRYADLDLSREAGVETLYRRLRIAARQVCGDRDPRHFDTLKDWRECFASALGQAVADVGNAQLEVLHSERNGGDPAAAFGLAGAP